jgi:hypothetical protein
MMYQVYNVWVKFPGEECATRHAVTANKLMRLLYTLAEIGKADVTVSTQVGRATRLVWLADRRPITLWGDA